MRSGNCCFKRKGVWVIAKIVAWRAPLAVCPLLSRAKKSNDDVGVKNSNHGRLGDEESTALPSSAWPLMLMEPALIKDRELGPPISAPLRHRRWPGPDNGTKGSHVTTCTATKAHNLCSSDRRWSWKCFFCSWVHDDCVHSVLQSSRLNTYSTTSLLSEQVLTHCAWRCSIRLIGKKRRSECSGEGKDNRKGKHASSLVILLKLLIFRACAPARTKTPND